MMSGDRRYGLWARGHLRLATRAEAAAQNVVVCPELCNYIDCPGPTHPAGQENNYLHSKYTRGTWWLLITVRCYRVATNIIIPSWWLSLDIVTMSRWHNVTKHLTPGRGMMSNYVMTLPFNKHHRHINSYFQDKFGELSGVSLKRFATLMCLQFIFPPPMVLTSDDHEVT